MKRLLCGVVLACALLVWPVFVFADSSTVYVNATVPGQAPETAPVIETPVAGSTLQDQQITVSGSCTSGLVVKVFRNNVFAGSALCQSDNSFSMQIELVENKNDLAARQYDLLNQSSPESETVTVFYAISKPGRDETAKFQLMIDYDYSFQGIFVNEPFNLPVHFAGGTPPYAVSIDWGDGQTTVISREDATEFHAEYTFTQSGARIVKIHVSDKEGQEASLQFVLIVNGGSATAEPLSHYDKSGTGTNKQITLKSAVYSSAITGGASFTAGFLVSTFWESIRFKFIGKILSKIWPFGPKP